LYGLEDDVRRSRRLPAREDTLDPPPGGKRVLAAFFGRKRRSGPNGDEIPAWRPLQGPVSSRSMGTEGIFSALTDVGRKREHNEDNFLVDKKLGLYVVCDGMGGHAAGEVASALAVRVLHEEVKKERDLIEDFAAGKTGLDRVSKRDITNMLEFAVNRASARVHAEAVRDPTKRGMGTTLVCVLLVAQQAFVTYCGD